MFIYSIIATPYLACCLVLIRSTLDYYAPDPREGGNKRCFCRSVRLSVVYIANNSRTQRPSVPKFGSKVLHHRCDLRTSFKVKRSRVRVTRPTDADTYAYRPNGKAYVFQT